jgi:hypothetical protein
MSSLAKEKITSEQIDINRERLIQDVRDLINTPISSWAVAATIESLGVRDIDAETDYGYQSVFDLAEFVYTEIETRILEEGQNETEKKPHGGVIRNLKFFFKYYSAGLVLSLPMLLQIAAILIFEYALWAWLRFNEAQATVIALGTIAAFVLTGGFIQVIGRLVSKYKGEENYFLASKAIWRVLRIAVPFVLITALVTVIFNFIFPFFPHSMIFLSIVYYVLIAGLLLSAAVLFASELRFMILFSIVVGTITVIFLMEATQLGIYLSQWIAIALTSFLMGIYSYLYYRIKLKTSKQELFKQSLPNGEISFYNNYRFFLYGFIYFLFLFLDRILAWSAGPPPPEYIIWFVTPYELGMDWALISFVISIAALEFSIYSFSDYLIPTQKQYSFGDIRKFNSFYTSFYRNQVGVLFVICIISIVVTYFGVLSLKAYQDIVPEIRDFFANPVTYKVFWIAAIGYIFLAWGLLNSLFFFTLNRPSYVVYSIAGALAVNFISGFLSSRLFGFEYATIGLLLGSITFAFSTFVLARKFFKHLDYYYYSAY